MMERKEKIVKVLFDDRVLKISLDLPRGRDTCVDGFSPLKDGWDVELEMRGRSTQLKLEEGSVLSFDWPENSPLGTLSLTVARWWHFDTTKDIWNESIPLAILNEGPEGEAHILWLDRWIG